VSGDGGQVIRRGPAARSVRRSTYGRNCADMIGPISPGCEIYCLQRGQFSLIDLLEHLLGQTGPADLIVSTWTAAGADIDYARRFLDDDRVRSCRWLVDFSFPARQPGYCAALRDRFGDGNIRATKNHAKFLLVRNERWNLAVRTSMNLNENRRLESVEISDDPDLAGWLQTVVDDIFAAPTNIGDRPSDIARRFAEDAHVPAADPAAHGNDTARSGVSYD
jgi:hypothetical protein